MPAINSFDMTVEAYQSICKSQLDTVEWKFLLVDQDSNDEITRWQYRFPSTIYERYSPKITLSTAWNNGIRKALAWGADYIAILNNDIVMHPKTLSHLMAFMDKTEYLMVTADNIADRMSIETMQQMELPNKYTDYDTQPIGDWRAEGPDFSCFMINPTTVDIIGFFDENFKGAYCEDQDFHVRIRRAYEHIKKHNDFGIDAERVHAKRLSTAPYYHYASNTIKTQENIRLEVSVQHGKNERYYINKWGGAHPFCMDGNGHQQPFGDAGKNWKDWSLK